MVFDGKHNRFDHQSLRFICKYDGILHKLVIHVCFLGEFQISRDCQELEPSIGEQLALLLYLEPDSELMVS